MIVAVTVQRARLLFSRRYSKSRPEGGAICSQNGCSWLQALTCTSGSLPIKVAWTWSSQGVRECECVPAPRYDGPLIPSCLGSQTASRLEKCVRIKPLMADALCEKAGDMPEAMTGFIKLPA